MSGAVEPEVLESLAELERAGHRPGGPHGARGPNGPFGPVGCAVGPGCGCAGLPLALLALLAGGVLSALLALLWLLSLGRVPVSLLHLARRLRRGRR